MTALVGNPSCWAPTGRPGILAALYDLCEEALGDRSPQPRACHSSPVTDRGIPSSLREACFSRIVLLAVRNGGAGEGSGVPTEDLIRRFQRGQPRAFEALYNRFKDYVYRIALFVTRNSDVAEDAVQATFLDVLRALPDYRIEGPARFKTWLYRVTVNRCRSMLRRKQTPSADWYDIEERLRRIPESHPDHDPENVVLRQERAAAIWQEVDDLPEGQRIVVLLRYHEGLSYKEIARTLDVKLGTVKSRLYYAHRKLKERLQSAEDALVPQEVEV